MLKALIQIYNLGVVTLSVIITKNFSSSHDHQGIYIKQLPVEYTTFVNCVFN